MDDPAVRLRLLVEDEELFVRIIPVTPSIAAPSVLSPPIVVRLILDDDGSVRAQIREAPPALPPPLDPETERRLDAFSAKRWDAVRRPAPPPQQIYEQVDLRPPSLVSVPPMDDAELA